MNDFLIYGIVLLVVGYLLEGLTTLVTLGSVLVLLGWIGVIIGAVLLLLAFLRGRR